MIKSYLNLSQYLKYIFFLYILGGSFGDAIVAWCLKCFVFFITIYEDGDGDL